ncbi:MAG: hypothetical protein WAM39_19295 [Bryobacteraceae bacterium]
MIGTRLPAVLALASLAYAATTATWETSSTSDFLKGRLEGLSLTPDGWLRPGPAMAVQASLNEPVLWSLIPAPDGGVYASTGHTGKVYHVSRSGKATLIWKADQPEVFALCIDGKGRLYAGTSPNGGVYRIDEGKAEEVAHLGAKYIWALAPAADGSLFAATGDRGRIYRVEENGQTQVYFETGQSNVTALALGFSGHLYAGTEPNGLLYDITAAGHGTVIFRSSLPEIHAIAVKKDGTLFASALGGSLTSRVANATAATAGTTGAVVASTPTVISVTEAKENGGVDTPDQNADLKVQSAKGAASPAPATPAATPSYTEVPGVEKSAVYRINSNGAIDTLRTSKDENVYDLALNGDTITFSTDVHGRLYSMLPDRKQTLLAETGNNDANRVVKTAAGIWVGLSNPAKVVLISGSTAANPLYESPVHDTISLARWGRLSWQATEPGLRFRTRTGNSSRPDATWSNWSEPIRDENGALITSPRGRYIQWQVEWPAKSTSELESVTVPFLAQNNAPVVRSISVSSIASNAQGNRSSPSAGSSDQNAYTVTVTDTGDASSSTTGTTSQTSNRQTENQTQLTWQADDPDNDKLVYSVYFRGDGERDWKLLRKDLFENTLRLDADALADGKYFFKVIASDRPSNDLRYAQEAELVSSPVLIDNTPPAITSAAPERNGTKVTLSFKGEDKTTALRKCEYSVDAGPWQPLEAADGITDSKEENFRLEIDDLPPGEHVIALRVYDGAGNAGLARVVVH